MASFILVTGLPGVGKTTMVRNVVDDLRKLSDVTVKGFYTEEVSDEDHQRIGFDYVTFEGERGFLARVGTSATGGRQRQVGRYSVQLQEFDSGCLHNLERFDETSLLVIDEVGTMELLSNRFQMLIQNILATDRRIKVLATVPFKNSIPLVQQLKAHPRSQIFHVSKTNRDQLFDQVLKATQNLVN